MPSLKQDTIEYYNTRIRKMMTIIPNVSVLAIQRALESDPNDPLHLQRDFLTKLVRKIKGERKFRFTGEEAQKALAEFQEKKDAVVEEMWKILLSNTAKDDVRISAARTIMESEDRFLSKQMDAGIFERKLGTYELKGKFVEEHRVLVLQAFRNFGILKDDNTLDLPEEKHEPTKK